MEELELRSEIRLRCIRQYDHPQIAENLTQRRVSEIPKECPVCKKPTKISMKIMKTLYCMNPKCQAKHVKSFSLFASRDAMNIEGLSESDFGKFIINGMSKILRISSILTDMKRK